MKRFYIVIGICSWVLGALQIDYEMFREASGEDLPIIEEKSVPFRVYSAKHELSEFFIEPVSIETDSVLNCIKIKIDSSHIISCEEEIKNLVDALKNASGTISADLKWAPTPGFSLYKDSQKINLSPLSINNINYTRIDIPPIKSGYIEQKTISFYIDDKTRKSILKFIEPNVTETIYVARN